MASFAKHVALSLGLASAQQLRGQGGCPAFPETTFSADPSPFGWPVSPNNFNFADLPSWEKKYLFCGGTHQSPIDITTNSSTCAVVEKGPVGSLAKAAHYKPADGHPTVKVSSYMRTAFVEDDFGTLTLKDADGHDVEYEATQIHLTANSLHTVDGKHHGAELLIFHKPKGHANMVQGGVAVSVFFDPDVNASSSIFEQMGFVKGDSSILDSRGTWHAPHYLDLPAVMENALDGGSYSYQGSVPVPPCSENIQYYILDHVQKVHPAQLAKLEAVLTCYAGGTAKRGSLPNPFLSKCREITKNDLEVHAADHSHDTCLVAAKNGTSTHSAACWDISMADAEKANCMKTPIDASEAKAGSAAHGSSPVFAFKSVEEAIVHPSDFTLDVTVPDHSKYEHGTFGQVLVNGRNFLVRKISVKPISSHTYDGIHHAGELQIEGVLFGDEIEAGASQAASTTVDHGAGHRRLADSSGGLHRVIMSVPMKLGSESALLRQIGLPFEAYRGTIKNGGSYHIKNTIDLKAGVQPALDGKWLWYSGGFATPGCSDWGVRWMLFETAIEVSLEQLNFLDLKVSGTDSTRPYGHTMSAADYKSHVSSMSLPGSAVDMHADCNTSHGWDYADTHCWAEKYPTCGTGQKQSPINIETSKITKTGKDDFLHKTSWRPVRGLHVVNNGHGLVVANDAFGYMEIIGEDGFPEYFQATQIRLHMPSEHMIDGKQFAAELQVVHRRQRVVSQIPNSLDAYPLVTASFLFDLSDHESPLLKQFLDHHIAENDHNTVKRPIDLLRSLGPALDGNFFRYNGSTTSPDCHESNYWFVFEHAFDMSAAQWAAFKAMFPHMGNNRPVQSLNGREVVKNSFEQPAVVKYDFYLGRHNGRNRFAPGEGYILFPVFGSLVVMSIIMLADFVRERRRNKDQAGGLAETIGRGTYNRM
eukprot:TRINITY_DN1303_c0_g2_i1.p1 TRINITY_DN1303_c0_g2~~TRINITY_DN1303_c0_g2_i1.p1  ORF type:complete len:927 (+),score=154.77 TRINITY_DN1303_c0_g2_i1:53-2833(+)